MLTTMFSRIEKRRTCSCHLKTVSRNITLELILQSPIKMASYYYYKSKGFLCFACPSHSDRCSKYVRDNQFYCDIRSLSILQFHKIAIQHFKTESELIRTEEEWSSLNKKMIRLRKQKKL